jgi:beta-alanine degradation protein BauB
MELMAEDRVLGGVGTKLLFENDRVKVWEMALEPGEESAVHRHDLDYVMVQVDGDRMAGVSEPDSEGPYPGYIEGEVAPGNVLSAKRGGIETARNVGKKAFYEIIVELKD